MKRIRSGKYLYNGYEITNHGYYPPDKRIWWEAVDLSTGCADFHSETKKGIKQLIDDSNNKQP